MDRFLRILKLVKSCEDQDFCRRVLFLYRLGQLHAVHVRHLNVRHDYIGLELFHHLKGFHAIISISDHQESQPLPIDLPSHNLYHFFFVVHQKHCILIHVRLPLRADLSLLYNIVASTDINCKGTYALCESVRPLFKNRVSLF